MHSVEMLDSPSIMNPWRRSFHHGLRRMVVLDEDNAWRCCRYFVEFTHSESAASVFMPWVEQGVDDPQRYHRGNGTSDIWRCSTS